MDEKWIPLVYNDYDLGTFFEYTLEGEFRNAQTKRRVKQRGKHIVLYIDGDLLRVNKEILLPELYENEKEERESKTIKDLEEKIAQLVKDEVTAQLEVRLGKTETEK